MSTPDQRQPKENGERSSAADDLARRAEAKASGLAGELLEFLRLNRKWWLLPIIAVLLLLGVFILLSSTAAAPFIYTLF